MASLTAMMQETLSISGILPDKNLWAPEICAGKVRAREPEPDQPGSTPVNDRALVFHVHWHLLFDYTRHCLSCRGNANHTQPRQHTHQPWWYRRICNLAEPALLPGWLVAQHESQLLTTFINELTKKAIDNLRTSAFEKKATAFHSEIKWLPSVVG